MIDLHTHILPGVDDGPTEISVSLEMLRMQKRQGVDVVALTSHFYPTHQNPECFCEKRQASYESLLEAIEQMPKEEQEKLPRMVLGAEVAFVPGLENLDYLEKLCYQGSSSILLELPFTPWNQQMFRQLYHFTERTGLQPILAHIDRYGNFQKKAHMQEILEMDMPMQISCRAFTGMFFRSRALSMLCNLNAIPVSDCHGVSYRPPNMEKAMTIIRRNLGNKVQEIICRAEEVLDNGK